MRRCKIKRRNKSVFCNDIMSGETVDFENYPFWGGRVINRQSAVWLPVL